MLEKERFLAIKNLAKRIRKENEPLFEAFKMEGPEDAIKEKEEFIETIIESMEDEFSTGELGKEEKQIFRANVLIPDDEEFLETYSKDKNIRNLMETYAVSIEDIMNKITELNIYDAYLDEAMSEKPVESKKAEMPKKAEEPKVEKTFRKPANRFVNDPVEEKYSTNLPKSPELNLSASEAESLLDEIENLSNAMEELETVKDSYQFDDEDIKEDIPNIEEKIEDHKETPEVELTYSSDMSIDDISAAVDGFVDDYNIIQEDLESSKKALHSSEKENTKLKDQVKKLKEDAYELKKTNLENTKLLKQEKDKNKKLENQNKELQDRIHDMEDKIKRSTALLRKIYDSIPKHNIKI